MLTRMQSRDAPKKRCKFGKSPPLSSHSNINFRLLVFMVPSDHHRRDPYQSEDLILVILTFHSLR